jgi:DNA-directed RNA polymerase subunit RPC12/RpoP
MSVVLFRCICGELLEPSGDHVLICPRCGLRSSKRWMREDPKDHPPDLRERA